MIVCEIMHILFDGFCYVDIKRTHQCAEEPAAGGRSSYELLFGATVEWAPLYYIYEYDEYDMRRIPWR